MASDNASGARNAKSRPASKRARSRPAGNGVSGKRSPMRQGAEAAGPSDVRTGTGVNATESRPRGRMTQPWSPNNRAERRRLPSSVR